MRIAEMRYALEASAAARALLASALATLLPPPWDRRADALYLGRGKEEDAVLDSKPRSNDEATPLYCDEDDIPSPPAGNGLQGQYRGMPSKCFSTGL